MLSTLEPAQRRALAVFILAFIVFGCAFTVIGAALPHVIRTFQWSYVLTGLVLGSVAVGYFVASFVGGVLVERVPPRFVVAGGLVIGAAGMLLFGRTGSAALNIVFGFAIGLCQGSIEIVTNLGVVRIEKPGQSRIMNLVHACFCIGAIAGPLAVGALVSRGVGSVIIVFAASAAVSVVLAAVFLVMPFPAAPAAHVEAAHARTRSLFREPLLLVLTVFLMLYVGAEIGVSNWISEFLVTGLGASTSFGAFVVAMFWGGILVGRLVISFAYHGQRQERVVAGITALALVSLLLVLLGRSIAVVAVGAALTGLGYSGVFPLVMAMVGRRFPSGVALGTAATGAGIGSFTFPFLMAVLANGVGVRGGFWFYTAIVAVLTVTAVGIGRGMRAAETSNRQ